MGEKSANKTRSTRQKKGIYQKKEVLNDYRIACESRQVSLLGRREVLTGKAKFGIFGDGKEVPQLAMAKVFKNGDWRSGYYRDQTFMFAAGLMQLEEFFAQLYGGTFKTPPALIVSKKWPSEVLESPMVPKATSSPFLENLLLPFNSCSCLNIFEANARPSNRGICPAVGEMSADTFFCFIRSFQ